MLGLLGLGIGPSECVLYLDETVVEEEAEEFSGDSWIGGGSRSNCVSDEKLCYRTRTSVEVKREVRGGSKKTRQKQKEMKKRGILLFIRGKL